MKSFVLRMSCVKQEKENWCYASICENLTRYYKPDTLITQKDIVTQIVKRYYSDEDIQKESYQMQDPFFYLKTNKVFTVKTVFKQTPLTFDTIRHEINNGNPIVVRIGGYDFGHYIIVIGYSVDKKCYIFDPSMEHIKSISVKNTLVYNKEDVNGYITLSALGCYSPAFLSDEEVQIKLISNL
jgi:hypothetical protein